MIRRFTIKGFKRFERETKIDLDAVSRLRAWLQERRLPLRINGDDIVDAMEAVPTDIQRVLRELQRLAGARRTGRGRNGN